MNRTKQSVLLETSVVPTKEYDTMERAKDFCYRMTLCGTALRFVYNNISLCDTSPLAANIL